MDYYIVSQGKTTIPSVDDGEEMGFTDVSPPKGIYGKMSKRFCPSCSFLIFFFLR
jgi:hypothetical protein